MATAGIFTLITNDGKQDKMLMATDLLKRRLAAVTQARKRAGLKDTTPTLLDIEKSHVLFMNSHFKPFAAIGFEYMKVKPESTVALGSDIRFSIPQFGDFFHDMALHVKFNQLVYTPTAAAPNADVFRYCDYPGERLVSKVKFDVNGNPLDEYDSDIQNFHRQFCVPPNKIAAWKRLVAHEDPQEGYLQQYSNAAAPTNRVKVSVCDGFQTPKAAHPALEVMVPLLFWFNKDPRHAIPSVAIPYGQRFITITLAAASSLVERVQLPGSDGSDTGTFPTLSISECSLFINNIFVNPEVHDIFIKRIGFTLIRVHRKQVSRQDKDNDSILLNNLKWPTECLFVALRPTANAASLQWWHHFDKCANSTTAVAGVQGSQVDATAVTEVAAIKAAADVAGTAQAQVDAYSALAKTTSAAQNLFGVAGAAAAATGATSTTVYTAVQTASNYYTAPTVDGSEAQMDYITCTPTIDRLSITAHGIDLYKEMPGSFFHSYTPYTLGGAQIMAPEDSGAHMVSFALYPGSHQPSGHINLSRAREFYFKYWSEGAVSTSADADLIVVASAINFLLISDGSAVLRYST